METYALYTQIYALWLFLLSIYFITLCTGMEYTPYRSLLEMIAHVERFEVLFRLLLGLLIFIPVLFIFFIHRARRYNNTNYIWLKKYFFTLFINIFAYILILMFNHPILNTLYYYISVGCSIYIVYMELFDRLIGKSIVGINIEEENAPYEEVISEYFQPPLNSEQKNIVLTDRWI